MNRQTDVVALVFGVVLTAVALLGLWQAFLGAVDWKLVQIAAPLGLVVVGIIGLVLSRHRT